MAAFLKSLQNMSRAQKQEVALKAEITENKMGVAPIGRLMLTMGIP